MIFKERYERNKQIVEHHLLSIFPDQEKYQNSLLNSMKYSVLNGGKRLRPILFIETLRMLETNFEPYLDIACAIELIHAHSLIHDDLPALDNDELRRGIPTNHIIFGEAIAILSGDALLNFAYELMFGWLSREFAQSNLNGLIEIARATGFKGMIGGQVLDMESENKEVSKEMMESIHKNKTGALIEASMVSAAHIASASSDYISSIRKYAKNLGLVFQIIDDILDVSGNEKILGKKIHQDKNKGKATYPRFFGIEESRKIAKIIAEESIHDISCFGKSSDFFSDLMVYVLTREN